MRSWGSLSQWIDIASRYIGAKISVPGWDNDDTPIDRQRRIIGLILFIIFIGLPAAFLLLSLLLP
jgi:hypothetical protein